MPTEKQTIYEDAVDLLERINKELQTNKQLDTLNSKMIGVVKDLNEVRIEEITGKKTEAQ